MQFNVVQLLKEPIGSTRQYELTEDINNLDPELAPLGPLVGEVQFMRTNSGLLAWGELSTAVQVACGRCLEPLAQTVRFSIEENFRPLVNAETGHLIRPDEFEGEEEDLEDDALIINEQHLLDLTEVVRQNIWVAIPTYPSCNWAGKGECPNFTAYKRDIGDVRLLLAGEQVAEQPAAQASPAVDPRWAALLALRGEITPEEPASPQSRTSGGQTKKPRKNAKLK